MSVQTPDMLIKMKEEVVKNLQQLLLVEMLLV